MCKKSVNSDAKSTLPQEYQNTTDTHLCKTKDSHCLYVIKKQVSGGQGARTLQKHTMQS